MALSQKDYNILINIFRISSMQNLLQKPLTQSSLSCLAKIDLTERYIRNAASAFSHTSQPGTMLQNLFCDNTKKAVKFWLFLMRYLWLKNGFAQAS